MSCVVKLSMLLFMLMQLASSCYDYSDPECYEKRMKELQDLIDKQAASAAAREAERKKMLPYKIRGMEGKDIKANLSDILQDEIPFYTSYASEVDSALNSYLRAPVRSEWNGMVEEEKRWEEGLRTLNEIMDKLQKRADGMRKTAQSIDRFFEFKFSELDDQVEWASQMAMANLYSK